MLVGGCSLYDEEDGYYSPVARVPAKTDWHSRQVRYGGETLAYLVQPQPNSSNPMKAQVVLVSGSAGASAEGKTDSDGSSSLTGEVHVNVKDHEGGRVNVTAEVKIERDRDGDFSTSGGIKVSVEKEF